MDLSSLDRSDPRRLASLFQAEDEAAGGVAACPWGPDDLGEILRHQLAAPILFGPDPAADRPTGAGPGGAGKAPVPPLSNFGDLLTHPAPPLELLRLTKEFAKASDTRPQCPLPKEVATALYYAAILAALLRHGQRITELSDRSLRSGAEWGLRQPWLPAQLRPLYQLGLDRLPAVGNAKGKANGATPGRGDGHGAG
jgi:hypothetical protein